MILLLPAGKDGPVVVHQQRHLPAELTAPVVLDGHHSRHLVPHPFERLQAEGLPPRHEGGRDDHDRQLGCSSRIVVHQRGGGAGSGPVGRHHHQDAGPGLLGVAGELHQLGCSPVPFGRHHHGPACCLVTDDPGHLGDIVVGQEGIEAVPPGQQHGGAAGLDGKIHIAPQPGVVDLTIPQKRSPDGSDRPGQTVSNLLLESIHGRLFLVWNTPVSLLMSRPVVWGYRPQAVLQCLQPKQPIP